jgi:acetylornithine deacetylase/succinyl-diaminopimelate desuccinylase-like protein
MTSQTDAATIYQRPAELLRTLLRFDTTNPPGNEAACIGYVRDLLAAVGIDATLLAKDPSRPNLIARLKGAGHAPPLLLQGHVDVVPTMHQPWTHPPFAAEVADGMIWGRGALDMKGGVAMLLAAFLRARAEEASLPGDVVLCLLSDEEAGGDAGARFLVEEHPALFAGIRFALGEFGGFTFHLGDRRFYPIMVAEKQSCVVRATVRGPGGHASTPVRGGATARLGQLLTRLDAQRLPVHVTPVARLMVETLASALAAPFSDVLTGLLDPQMTDSLLDSISGPIAPFDPLLHNTAVPTLVHGGEKNNVIPSEITVEVDGRILPGYTAAEFLAELSALLGAEVELEVLLHDPNPATTPDMGLFATLGDALRAGDPDAIPVPLLLMAVTDGRFFARLGIQTYGFLPMYLPGNWNFMQLIHAADERIPADAVNFGAEAIFRVLQRFGASA